MHVRKQRLLALLVSASALSGALFVVALQSDAQPEGPDPLGMPTCEAQDPATRSAFNWAWVEEHRAKGDLEEALDALNDAPTRDCVAPVERYTPSEPPEPRVLPSAQRSD